MDGAARRKLWEDYNRLKTSDLREKLILECMPIVDAVVGRYYSRANRDADYEDLAGYGIFGIMKAIDRLDAGRGAKLETYAYTCIRGAISNNLCKMKGMPHRVIDHGRETGRAMRELEIKSGRPPTDGELAAYMGISGKELSYRRNQVEMGDAISLDWYLEWNSDISSDGGKDSGFGTPEDAAECSELRDMLDEAPGFLTEREKNVIVLRYYDELTIKEICGALGMTDTNARTLCSKALKKLRMRMGK